MTRDENGRFIKGNGGGPGRPRKEREVEYYRIMQLHVTPDRWGKIVQKALEQAERGDAVARKWLADYLIGPPVERKEVTGDNGGPIILKVVYDE